MYRTAVGNTSRSGILQSKTRLGVLTASVTSGSIGLVIVQNIYSITALSFRCFFVCVFFGFTKAVIVTFTVSSAMSFVPFQYSVIVTFTLFIGDVISTISVFCHCYIYYIHRRCCFHRFSIMLLSVKTGIVQSACMCVCARLSGWVLIYSPYEWFAIVSDVVQCRDRYWHVTNARLFFSLYR